MLTNISEVLDALIIALMMEAASTSEIVNYMVQHPRRLSSSYSQL
jgi:hypothetical protein